MWTHFRIADLHVQAALATSPEHLEVYTTAVAKLMGEFRRTSLAIREFRSPIVAKNITVVKQQNVAAGDQQVALIEGRQPETPSGDKIVDSELGGNQGLLTHEHSTNFDTSPDCRAIVSIYCASGVPQIIPSFGSSSPSITRDTIRPFASAIGAPLHPL